MVTSIFCCNASPVFFASSASIFRCSVATRRLSLEASTSFFNSLTFASYSLIANSYELSECSICNLSSSAATSSFDTVDLSISIFLATLFNISRPIFCFAFVMRFALSCSLFVISITASISFSIQLEWVFIEFGRREVEADIDLFCRSTDISLRSVLSTERLVDNSVA